jgi:hypothetical protein
MALLYPYSLYPHCNIDTPPFSRGFFSFPDLHFGWLELDGPRCCEHSDISDYHSLTDETKNESQHHANGFQHASAACTIPASPNVTPQRCTDSLLLTSLARTFQQIPLVAVQ